VLTLNMKVVGPLFVGAIVGAFVGYWVDTSTEYRFDAPSTIVGLIAGALFGLAIGLLLAHQRRRWIATAGLAAFLLFVFLTSGWITTGLAVAAIMVTFVVSAGVLRGFYGDDDVAAVKHHIQIWTSIRGGFVVVDDGRIVMPTTPKPHMGPKLIIVRPGNAVVMVNGSKITQICGPSVFKSENFEFVDDVIKLERSSHVQTIPEIVTASVSTVTLRLSYRYGINVSESTIRGETKNDAPDAPRGLTPEEHANLRRVVAMHPKWEQEIERYIEGAVRGLLAQYEYDELVGNNHYQRLGRRISMLIAPHITELGCAVDLINVISVTPNPSLMDVHLEGQRIRQIQHAAGDGFRMAITSVAIGYREAIRLGMTLDDIHQEAARFMMEHMSDDPATKVVLTAPPRYSLDDIQGPPSIADDAIDGGEPRRLPPPTARGPGARA